MSALEKALPFGERKYKSFTYCGVQVSQDASGAIEMSQDVYISGMEPMPVKHLKEGPLPASEITRFKALCGTLAWPVINTQPQCAFDVSWLTSKSAAPTKADVSFGNKIMRRMQAEPQRLRYSRVASSVQDWRIVSYHDAGWATRPSLHSQAGGLVLVAHPDALTGKLVPCMLIDWVCAKIDRVVRSSFEAEINSAQLALDQMLLVCAGILMLTEGLSAREFSERRESVPAVLCGDNKGLFTSLEAMSPVSKKGERRLQIDKIIMNEHLKKHCVTYRWVNSSHQLADALTKLSTGGARVDLLNSLLRSNQVRVHYCTESGRKEEASSSSAQQRAPSGGDSASNPTRSKGLASDDVLQRVYAMDFLDDYNKANDEYYQDLTPDELAEWFTAGSSFALA
jgi:hypothetical protein